ncbi:MAG: molecular chaperone HtpG [Janthinobacterium lividum]
MSEADNQTAPEQAGETKTFQADVSRLLDLMVHSIYSERDVFLRELISNAADACEKLRYESIAEPQLTADGEGFSIRVVIDAAAKTLAIVDNGIGMGRDDLDRALGTIASSGTKAFLDRIGSEAEEESGNLIGQFGIGFYSAFMVASSVEVLTRRAGTDDAWRWTSDGKGSYAVAALPLDAAPSRGTRVTLHLNEEAAKEFLEPWRVERLIKEHSGAVAVPIDLQETPDGETRRLTDGAALWAKNKSEITPEQYTEFYRSLAAQYDDPALTIHYRAEGRHEYSVLAFVPGSKPFDLFDPQRKGRTKLYVRRVLITDEADLLPGWLRFVRAVVDTADLPLNVSREMVQNSPVFAAIRKGVTNRVLGDLTKMADNDPEGFAKVWENFGAVLKEGLYEDPERRDNLFKLARFASTKHPDGGRTLADYVADLRDNQTAIYYLVGDDLKRLGTSPQLEGFRARGIEVLLLPDAVDAFWVSNAAGFDGKPFKSVTQGAADIKAVPLAEGAKEPESQDVSPKLASLLVFMKETLAGSVEDVRASDRLSESPACLIAPEFGPDRRLEKILAQHGKLGEQTKPVLEINPGHPLVTALAERFAGTGDRAVVEDSAWLLHDEARIMDGELPADAALFAARLRRVMEKAAG